MTNINFSRDYGMPPPAPFWLIWREDGHYPWHKHETRDLAEAEAARLANECPGEKFHILAVMATVTTSRDVVGTRFDPSRIKLIERVEDLPTPTFVDDAPEFAEVDEAPTDAPAVDAHGDDQPF